MSLVLLVGAVAVGMVTGPEEVTVTAGNAEVGGIVCCELVAVGERELVGMVIKVAVGLIPVVAVGVKAWVGGAAAAVWVNPWSARRTAWVSTAPESGVGSTLMPPQALVNIVRIKKIYSVYFFIIVTASFK